MPNFNNCKTAIFATNNSKIKTNDPILIKDASVAGIVLKENSLLIAPGVSGVTASSLNIIACERGIYSDASRVNLNFAHIKETKIGFLAANSSNFNFDKNTVDGGKYYGFTGYAYGAYVVDASRGTFYDTNITGYTGGTGSQTSGNYVSVASSVVFAGTTTQTALINLNSGGVGIAGSAYTNTTKGVLAFGGPQNAPANFEPEP